VTGNYLISARHTSTLYYVNATDGSIIWQLSSMGTSNFNCTNFNFSFQHDARLISENSTTTFLSIFDNASDGSGEPASSPTSSGRFIQIDHTAGTATQYRQTFPPFDFVSTSQGNTQLLSNASDGHVFNGWGPVSWFSEVDGDNNLVLAGTYTTNDTNSITAISYRVFSDNWESTPANTVPAVYSYAQTTQDANDIYVSWNGATTVAQWQYYGASQSSGPCEVIGTTAKVGFETSWRAPQYYAYVQVEALGSGGESLANSSMHMTFVPSSALASSCDDATCPAVSTYASMS
jgi:hypothetical protein